MPEFAHAEIKADDISHGREMMLNAFEYEVREIETDWLEGIETLEDWEARRVELRRELAEMLGLWPEPPKTDLQATVTGTLDHPDFTVEKIHFQSVPGFYVTTNLYLPKNVEGKVPVVLYLSGHARRVVDGVSYGTKAAYQHHPAWYARQGIASMVVDTVDHGEIQGIHHGTFRHGRWWWYNRGYTPGAAEVWNAIRALDYLETRPEIDMQHVGATGRSGGGQYSWLLLSLDDRVTVATPTAGITDIRNHVIDDTIRGHCDCNFWNNYHRLDTTVMAALAAPRPVKLVNTDADGIFPVSGIRRVEERVRKIYELYGKEENWAVFIGEGGHKDTREVQLATFPWMYRFLKGEELGEVPEAIAYFENEEVKVFDQIPADEINTTIDEEFLPEPISPPVPLNEEQWASAKETWMEMLEAKTFAGWPTDAEETKLERVLTADLDSLELRADEFSPQKGITLRTWTLVKKDQSPDRVVVKLLNNDGWLNALSALQSAVSPERVEQIVGPGARSVVWPEADPEAMAELRKLTDEGAAVVFVATRGIGPTFYEEPRPNRGDTITRSFQLLGQTLDGMRVWDLRQALAAIRKAPDLAGKEIAVEAEGTMAGVALYASLFDEPVSQLRLDNLPHDHRNGPILISIDQILNLPQTFAMAKDRTEVELKGNTSVANWSNALRERLGAAE